MNHPGRLYTIFSALILLTACDTPDKGGTPPPSDHAAHSEAATYAITADPYTTLQAVWAPVEPTPQIEDRIRSGDLQETDIAEILQTDLGVRLDTGQPWIEHRELAPGFEPGKRGDRRSLAYIWQVADSQVIDEESPIRVSGSRVFRPHGHLAVHSFEAHVRTAANISKRGSRPFDFALLAGDLTDSSQWNEFDWVINILNGGVINPDSGLNDDPVSGPGNDYNDPFISTGIDVPWYAALGNHDGLYMGGLSELTDELVDAAQGVTPVTPADLPSKWGGYRDGSTLHADVVRNRETVADPNRRLLRKPEVIERLRQAGGAPEGHGFSDTDAVTGKGYFSAHPLPGKPLRLIALDTVNEHAARKYDGIRGAMSIEQHRWLRTELAAADAANELVVVLSHHRLSDFTRDSPVSSQQLASTLASSASVILHLTGHGHYNGMEIMRSTIPSADDAYWELMTSATLDFPMQSRIIELVDERNGYLSIYVTNFDHNSPAGTPAHQARRLAAAERAIAGKVGAFWKRDNAARNLLLRVKIPVTVRDRLAQFDWSPTIESEETLLSFRQPE